MRINQTDADLMLGWLHGCASDGQWVSEESLTLARKIGATYPKLQKDVAQIIDEAQTSAKWRN
jgi:hypothetical protein